jgi:hypothetical protein
MSICPDRADDRQRKTGRPIRLGLTEPPRQALDGYLIGDFAPVLEVSIVYSGFSSSKLAESPYFGVRRL